MTEGSQNQTRTATWVTGNLTALTISLLPDGRDMIFSSDRTLPA